MKKRLKLDYTIYTQEVEVDGTPTEVEFIKANYSLEQEDDSTGSS